MYCMGSPRYGEILFDWLPPSCDGVLLYGARSMVNEISIAVWPHSRDTQEAPLLGGSPGYSLNEYLMVQTPPIYQMSV